MKVVLDTNVLLAAFACGGVCRDVLKTCILVDHIYLSEFILEEFHRKLRDKFCMPEADCNANLAFLRSRCHIVTPEIVDAAACSDPNDLPVLGTLLAAEADCLITGDKALLQMQTFKEFSILSPRVYLDIPR